MAHRHVLILTSNVPPFASGGTPRLLRECECLPRQGWRVSVAGFSGQWQLPQLDPLPKSTTAWPVNVEPWWYRHVRRLKKIFSREDEKAVNGARPDKYLELLPGLLKVVERAVRRNPPDIIMVTIPSFSLLDAGFLARLDSLAPGRVVIERRDRFAHNPWHTRSEADIARAEAIERAAGPFVAGVTDDSQLFADTVKTWAPRALTEVISNGFVREHYVGKSLGLAWPGRREGVLRFQFVGRAYAHAVVRLLVPAFQRALVLRPELAPRLRFRFIGQFQPEFLGDWSDLGSTLELCDPIPYAEIPGAVERADVSTLVVADNAVSQGQPAAKVFEYLGASRPILAASNGAAAEIVRITQSGITANPHDPEALAAAILGFDDLWQADQPFPLGPQSLRDPWEANALAKKQAVFFERIIARKSG